MTETWVRLCCIVSYKAVVKEATNGKRRKKNEDDYAPHVSWSRYIEVVQPGARGRRGLDEILL